MYVRITYPDDGSIAILKSDYGIDNGGVYTAIWDKVIDRYRVNAPDATYEFTFRKEHKFIVEVKNLGMRMSI